MTRVPRPSARLLSDGAYVAAGQALSAVGAVAGIRLLTELVSPATFGAVTLAIGVGTLAINVACTPVTQAAIHFHPAFAAEGRLAVLTHALRRALARAATWLAAAGLAGGVAWMLAGDAEPGVLAAVAALVVVDGLRALQMALLNAGRQHRRYAAWSAAEAVLRPLAAAAAVLALGGTPLVVVLAYLATSVLLLAVFTDRTPPAAVPAADPALEQRIWRYALPLVPLGAVGWVNGLGDRYIIAGALTVADAGIYAAAYGLVSRPFLMLGQTVELTLRPLYQAAVTAGDTPRADRLLRTWFLAVSSAGLAGVAVVAVASGLLARLLLGPEFRSGAALMPWIAAGYALIIVAHVFERVCFAYGRTRWVLVIQTGSAVAGLAATLVGALGWGLQGAAVAVPVYFAVQLGLSVVAAWDTRRRALGPPAGAAAA